ncbi:L10-interacting MYB domain-containing protein-like [Olea europaea var. sylvestris]|uniref:L10-interacting MYB domain-containing protein-like n=1 Tax=Olea europaea var. sylvestris TaxID=158386 RepID=UPI000C1D4761|nr:L10-interacting MYB domain-containing protein-like [Olea europaea var. sylvestris]
MDPAHTPCGRGPPPSLFVAQELGQASGAKSYAWWNALETQTFIVACETAIAEGHRSGRCFTKQGWARISKLFNSATGHNWTKQQLRNHWDAMRRTYRRLFDLLKGSGVEYNKSTGRVVASEEWWNRKIRVTISIRGTHFSQYVTKQSRSVFFSTFGMPFFVSSLFFVPLFTGE